MSTTSVLLSVWILCVGFWVAVAIHDQIAQARLLEEQYRRCRAWAHFVAVRDARARNRGRTVRDPTEHRGSQG